MNPTLYVMTGVISQGLPTYESKCKSYFDKDQPLPEPHLRVQNWLQSTSVHKSLQILRSKASYSESLVDGIFCAMLFSSASIQFAYDKSTLENSNLFLKIAIAVLSAIEEVYNVENVMVTEFRLMKGMVCYIQPFWTTYIKQNYLIKLFKELESAVPGPEEEVNLFNKVVLM